MSSDRARSYRDIRQSIETAAQANTFIDDVAQLTALIECMRQQTALVVKPVVSVVSSAFCISQLTTTDDGPPCKRTRSHQTSPSNGTPVVMVDNDDAALLRETISLYGNCCHLTSKACAISSQRGILALFETLLQSPHTPSPITAVVIRCIGNIVNDKPMAQVLLVHHKAIFVRLLQLAEKCDLTPTGDRRPGVLHYILRALRLLALSGPREFTLPRSTIADICRLMLSMSTMSSLAVVFGRLAAIAPQRERDDQLTVACHKVMLAVLRQTDVKECGRQIARCEQAVAAVNEQLVNLTESSDLTQLIDVLLTDSFDFRSALVQAHGIDALVGRYSLLEEETAKDLTLQRVMLFAQDGFGRSALLKNGAMELIIERYSQCLSSERDETVMMAAVTFVYYIDALRVLAKGDKFLPIVGRHLAQYTECNRMAVCDADVVQTRKIVPSQPRTSTTDEFRADSPEYQAIKQSIESRTSTANQSPAVHPMFLNRGNTVGSSPFHYPIMPSSWSPSAMSSGSTNNSPQSRSPTSPIGRPTVWRSASCSSLSSIDDALPMSSWQSPPDHQPLLDDMSLWDIRRFYHKPSTSTNGICALHHSATATLESVEHRLMCCSCAHCTRLQLLGREIIFDVSSVIESRFGMSELRNAVRTHSIEGDYAALAVPYECISHQSRHSALIVDGCLNRIFELLARSLTYPSKSPSLLDVCKSIVMIARAEGELLDALLSESLPSRASTSTQHDCRLPLTADVDGGTTLTYTTDDGDQFIADKKMLIEFSPYFASMIDGAFVEREQNVIEFSPEKHGCTFAQYKVLLSYAHNCGLHNTHSSIDSLADVLALCRLADEHMCRPITVDLVNRVLLPFLTRSNATVIVQATLNLMHGQYVCDTLCRVGCGEDIAALFDGLSTADGEQLVSRIRSFVEKFIPSS